MDCGSCSREIVETIEKHSEHFYIRANRSGSLYDCMLALRGWQAGHKSLRTEEDKSYQSLRVQVLCKQSGIAERISVPAKWIRTARHYQLNIYTDNKSYQNPFAFTDG